MVMLAVIVPRALSKTISNTCLRDKNINCGLSWPIMLCIIKENLLLELGNLKLEEEWEKRNQYGLRLGFREGSMLTVRNHACASKL